MNGRHVKMLLRRSLLLGAIAAALFVLVLRGTPCIFKQLTAVPCPTCGMSRAWLAVFRLDMSAAFQYHPMFWGIAALGLLYILDGLPFPGKRCTRALYLLILVGFAVTYILRLVYFLGGVNAG